MPDPKYAALASALCLLTAAPLPAEQLLYFNSAAGDLYQSKPKGSSVEVVRENVGASVNYMFLTHEHIYFSDRDGNTLNRMELDGSNLTVLADASDGVIGPHGLTLNHQGTGLFFGSRAGLGLTGSIDHVDFATGAVTEFVPNVSAPGGVEMKNNTLFWVDTGTRSVWTRSLIGFPTQLVTIPSAGLTLSDLVVRQNAGGIILAYASSATEIYRISKFPLTSPSVTVVHSDASARFTGIDADDTHLYFADRNNDRVLRYELGSGPAEVIQTPAGAPGLDSPEGIAITQLPGISINDVSASEANGLALFTVSLTIPAPCDVSVKIITNNESATYPFDFLHPPSVLTIPAGITSGNIGVPIINDGAFEPEETFTVDIERPTFGTLHDPSGRATIIARSTIENSKRHSWGQNIGWTLWSPASGRQDAGAGVTSNFLVGKIWNQNVGWINLGNGSPTDGIRYSNRTPTDFGVNLLPGGLLVGHAWGQNIGWVTFEQVHGQPKIDYATGEFSGYAWSQNCGWLNIGTKTTSHYVQTNMIEIVDSDHDMIDDGWELDQGARSLTQLSATGDADGDGTSDLDEFNADTNPFDVDDYFRLISLTKFPEQATNNIELTWRGSASRLYDVFASEDVGGWGAPVAIDVPGSSPTTTKSLTEPLPLPVREFWKVDSKRPLAP